MSLVRRAAEIGFRHLVAWCLCSVLLGGCTETLRQLTETAENGLAPSRQQEFTEPYHGPKAHVAVSRFTVTSRAPAQIGEGLADMLRAALAESGRFTPIEPLKPEDLDALKGGSAVKFVSQKAKTTGEKFVKPDLLVLGAVTEFEQGNSENKATFLGNSPIGRLLGSTLLDVKSSDISINIRLVDVTTNNIVASTVVSRKVSDIDNLSFPGGNLGFGLQGYAKPPMQQAIRLAVEDAVHFLIEATPPKYFQSS